MHSLLPTTAYRQRILSSPIWHELGPFCWEFVRGGRALHRSTLNHVVEPRAGCGLILGSHLYVFFSGFPNEPSLIQFCENHRWRSQKRSLQVKLAFVSLTKAGLLCISPTKPISESFALSFTSTDPKTHNLQV